MSDKIIVGLFGAALAVLGFFLTPPVVMQTILGVPVAIVGCSMVAHALGL